MVELGLDLHFDSGRAILSFDLAKACAFFGVGFGKFYNDGIGVELES